MQRIYEVMTDTQLIAPVPETTPVESGIMGGRVRDLPYDLLKEASKRLQIMSLVAAALWILGTTGYRIAFLAEASTILASSLDYHTNLMTVAKLAVNRLADWCAVDVVSDEEEFHRHPNVQRVESDQRGQMEVGEEQEVEAVLQAIEFILIKFYKNGKKSKIIVKTSINIHREPMTY